MIKINLLSPFDKENLKWEKYNSMMIRTAFWIFFVEAIFAAAFVFSLEYLKIEEGSVNSQLVSLKAQKDTKEIKDMESSLAAYKSKIDNIYSIQNNHSEWTSLFEGLSALIPDNVKLQSITIADDVPDSKNSQDSQNVSDDTLSKTPQKTQSVATRLKVQITGNAKTRDDLLRLENNLKRSDFFSNLEYDDSNYIKSKDINFSYAFYVSKEKLLK